MHFRRKSQQSALNFDEFGLFSQNVVFSLFTLARAVLVTFQLSLFVCSQFSWEYEYMQHNPEQVDSDVGLNQLYKLCTELVNLLRGERTVMKWGRSSHTHTSHSNFQLVWIWLRIVLYTVREKISYSFQAYSFGMPSRVTHKEALETFCKGRWGCYHICWKFPKIPYAATCDGISLTF